MADLLHLKFIPCGTCRDKPPLAKGMPDWCEMCYTRSGYTHIINGLVDILNSTNRRLDNIDERVDFIEEQLGANA